MMAANAKHLLLVVSGRNAVDLWSPSPVGGSHIETAPDLAPGVNFGARLDALGPGEAA